MNQPIKSYTIYFLSASGSCIFYFGIDGTNKKKVTKMANEMAKLVEAYYKTEMWSIGKVSTQVEEQKPHH